MAKAINECLFCKNRFCYERVVSIDPTVHYDEVACTRHVAELHKHSDQTAPGVMKRFISSCSVLKRERSIKPSNQIAYVHRYEQNV